MFYGRDKELKLLKTLFKQSKDSAKLAVLTGRRRVGKTLLSLEFCKSLPHLYFFISKKAETLLAREFLAEIKTQYDIPVIGDIYSFIDVFRIVLDISKKKPLILIIDEFQRFFDINPSIYSDIQKLWDLHKSTAKLLLICNGSVFSLMTKIFENENEPLFGRADQVINLKPFKVNVAHKILLEHKINNLETLFDYYLITGFVPKYMNLLLEEKAQTRKKIIDLIVQEHSLLLFEGKNLLIEELGKEYGIYFSILELIARGKTTRSEIESILERSIGGYLERLELIYNIITPKIPITAKPNSRSIHYVINDNFLRFWFAFIHRYRSAIEIENYNYIKERINEKYNTFSGKVLELFYKDLLASTGQYNIIGSYWESKGHENEIDLIAINDAKRQITLAEVKRNQKKINLNALKMKSKNVLQHFPGYEPIWLGLSLTEIEKYLV